MSVDHEPVTAALLTALLTTGFAVGDHEAPSPAPTDQPYSILYAIPGGGTWGRPLVDPARSAELVYQVTCIGQRRDQVEMLADRQRLVVLGRTPAGAFSTPITPTGLAVIHRTLDSFGGLDKAGEIWSSSERYRLTVTPT